MNTPYKVAYTLQELRPKPRDLIVVLTDDYNLRIGYYIARDIWEIGELHTSYDSNVKMWRNATDKEKDDYAEKSSSHQDTSRVVSSF